MDTRKAIDPFINELSKHKLEDIKSKSKVNQNLLSEFLKLFERWSKQPLKEEVITAFKYHEFNPDELEKISLLFDKTNLPEFNISNQSFEQFCKAIGRDEMYRVLQKHKEIQSDIKFDQAINQVKTKKTQPPSSVWESARKMKEEAKPQTKETRSPPQKKK